MIFAATEKGEKMAEYIEREELMRCIKEIHCADVATVRHGTWLSQCDKTHFCSECGTDALFEQFDTFCFREKLSGLCPCCGAVMDGERKDDD